MNLSIIYIFRNRWQRGNYFVGESIRRAEVQVRVGKLKNGKAAVKDEITGEMIKGGGLNLEAV